jgi:hypothetical protein
VTGAHPPHSLGFQRADTACDPDPGSGVGLTAASHGGPDAGRMYDYTLGAMNNRSPACRPPLGWAS